MGNFFNAMVTIYLFSAGRALPPDGGAVAQPGSAVGRGGKLCKTLYGKGPKGASQWRLQTEI